MFGVRGLFFEDSTNKGEKKKMSSEQEPNRRSSSKAYFSKGDTLASKTTEAFNKTKLNDKAGFNSLQRIFIEQARLNSWLWGGAAACFLLA